MGGRKEERDALLGQVVDGRYRIEERLGAGGMGVVYRARQLKVDRDVALKLLRRERLGDAGAVKRFVAEARVISKLSSPHTVTLLDVGEVDDGDFYLAMELLEGRTLRDRLREGPLTLADAVEILDPVCLSLAEAHARGIVHRDLKPSNVFLAHTLGHDAFAKVLDFGLAALVGSRAEGLSGTPRYMAPELIGGGRPTPRADVYALGIMLVELLTGQSPFAAEDTNAMLRAHVEDEPRSLSKLAPELEVPDAIQSLIARCLAKPPRLRPDGAAPFREALLEATGNASTRERASASPVVHRRTSEPDVDTKATLPSILSLSGLDRPSREPRRASTWMLAAAALAVSAGAWWWTREPAPAPAEARSEADPTPPVVPSPPPRADTLSPTETAAVDPRPDMIPLLVHTIPDGAAVLVDAKKRGETPVTVYFPKGESAVLELRRPGFVVERVPVSVEKEGKLRRVLKRVATPPAASPSVPEKMQRYLD